MSQLGFYLDQSRCTGCDTCTIACKDWNDLGEHSAWRWTKCIEEGKYPNPRVNFLSLSCLHCANPPCAEVCPAEAITKRDEDGIVLVDREKCLGVEKCGAPCKEACPYDAPQLTGKGNAKMQKCDFCAERWAEGKRPICVEACPVNALEAGPLDELVAKHGNSTKAVGFVYTSRVAPAVIFKTKGGKHEHSHESKG